jgi:hypothetical protein
MVRMAPSISRLAGMGSALPKRGVPLIIGLPASVPDGRAGNFSSSVATAPVSFVAILVFVSLLVQWLATALNWMGCSVVRSEFAGAGYTIPMIESRPVDYLHFLGLGLFIGAGLLSALLPRRVRLSGATLVFMTLMLTSCTCWWILGYEPSEYLRSLGAYHSPFTFVMCLGVIAGFDPSLWRFIRPLLLTLAYASMVCGAYYTLRFGFMASFQGPTPMVEHLQISFWLALVVLVLAPPERWLQSGLALVPILTCIPTAVVISSRSFTVLSTLALAFGLLCALRGRIRFSANNIVAVAGVTTIVVSALLFLLSVTAPERFLALKERVFDDSRSSQYVQFFDQVPVERLILGLGPKATYTYNLRANYEYIDNQFLYILFKLGLPVLLGYVAVVLWPGLRLLLEPVNQSQRMEGVIFLFWILASLGLSIYHALVPNPQNFLIILLAGRAVALRQETATPAFPAIAGSLPAWARRRPRSASGGRFHRARATVLRARSLREAR